MISLSPNGEPCASAVFCLLGAPNPIIVLQQIKTGLSATSRLHDLFVNLQAMTPAEYKNGGTSLEIKYSFNKSIYGDYLIASTTKGICNLIFASSKF